MHAQHATWVTVHHRSIGIMYHGSVRGRQYIARNVQREHVLHAVCRNACACMRMHVPWCRDQAAACQRTLPEAFALAPALPSALPSAIHISSHTRTWSQPPEPKGTASWASHARARLQTKLAPCPPREAAACPSELSKPPIQAAYPCCLLSELRGDELDADWHALARGEHDRVAARGERHQPRISVADGVLCAS